MDACVGLAEEVHRRDGYPVYLRTGLREFLVTADALAAWVAEDEGRLVGHVALHRHTVPAALDLAGRALSVPVEQLGVVARLLVDPGARRGGVGEALLATAAGEARARGLWPVLDVGTRFAPAVALYERCGWVRAGQVDLSLGGETMTEAVYLAPAGPGVIRRRPAPPPRR